MKDEGNGQNAAWLESIKCAGSTQGGESICGSVGGQVAFLNWIVVVCL